jgi:Tol biopolymer transport system component
MSTMTIREMGAALAAVVALFHPLSVAGDTRAVAVVGDHSPDGNGVFKQFSSPVLNDAGQLAFYAVLIGTIGGSEDNTGIFSSDGTSLTKIVRKGETVPDGTAKYSDFGVPAIDNQGRLVFVALLTKTNGSLRSGIFATPVGGGAIQEIVRVYNTTPDGMDLYGDTNPFGSPIVNNTGKFVFSSSLVDMLDHPDGIGMYAFDGSEVTQIMRSGQALPGGNRAFARPGLPSLNDEGLVAFRTELITGTGFSAGDGVVLTDGSTFHLVVRADGPTPDGTGTFGFGDTTAPALNNSGQLAFTTPVFGPLGKFWSLYRGNDATIEEVVRLDQFTQLDMNETGQIAIDAVIPPAADRGIYRIPAGSGSPQLLVKNGDGPPDGNGTLPLLTGTKWSVPLINNAGQVVFGSNIFGSSIGEGDVALFLYDDGAGLVQIARTGDAFLGSSVVGLSANIVSPVRGYRGLSNSGQFGYFFQLADGRSGVAVAGGLDQLPTRTSTPSATLTPTGTPTKTATPQPNSTPTITSSPSPSPTRMPMACVGDCGGDGAVTVDELIAMVNIALGSAPIGRCIAGDSNHDATIGISEIIAAVNSALGGCPVAGTTNLISVNWTGTAGGNGSSFDPSMSADGRFLAFGSAAEDLVSGGIDANRAPDVFLYDAQTARTTLVSYNRTGAATGNDGSSTPVLSRDGRFIVFSSEATDLVDGISDLNRTSDLFVRDLEAGVTTLVSVNFAGTGTGNGNSNSAVISADGRFIAFASSASDLVAPGVDINHLTDVFVRDVQAGITMLVSVNASGRASGNEHSFAPAISADGHRIAFQSGASDLVADGIDDNAAEDIFVRDLENGVTTLVSVNSAGTGSADTHSTTPVISSDGRVVAFESYADDLLPRGVDNNATGDIFVRDLAAATTTAISVIPAGTATGKRDSVTGALPVLSADGRFVAFVSSAPDLVAPETDGRYNVFLRDRQLGKTILVTADPTGAAAGEAGGPTFNKLALSADARFVAFESEATTLARGIADQNDSPDVFLRDTRSGTTTMVSTNRDRTASGNGPSSSPLLSANGKVLAFMSSAHDLVDPSVTNFTHLYRFSR